ncbi:tail fiber protein [Nostoc sp. 'Peltigera membranacea cyanobiont' N6]|uniref:tail fiber protein n=1 Tax=Nostoc sp. 'Peltigera membranacea cyanobiont' N6 TaxID=1261031 RepID=UPI000CF33204|nr:tail fiber protein [Nostoc sp. 'Peltigera membranacea cyanobiont' N6]AVH67022.1 phage tail collar domain protein [Nostoc sp. 'Peltigera membranacea cyanobiont' N6]
MTRPILQNGDIFTAEIANAIAYPIVDGDDFLGHGPKVLDSSLDDTPGQIKSNFYNFYNRLQVSHTSGLAFNYLGGVVLLADGSTVSITPGSISIPNNVTRYIFIGNDGTVQASSVLPNESFPMAKVTTASGTLSGNIIDLRDKLVDRITPANIPVTQLIPPGASMEFSGSTLPSGWLWEDGAYYAPSTYPALFSAIGYTHGQSGSNFRVPDSRGRVSVGAGTGTGLTNRVLGQTGGLEGVTLNVAQTPPHTHSVNDFAHSHSVNESPHLHTINDPSHSHGVADAGHAHGVYDPGHAHSLRPFRQYAEGNGTRGNGAELTTIPGGSNIYPDTQPSLTGIGIVAGSANIGIYGAVTGINMAGAKTNVSLNAATSNISLNTQGGGGSHENMQPWLAKNKIIKY